MLSNTVISERQISTLSARAIPKPASDQNTDDIIPARYMKEITFSNVGEYVYIDERIKDGKEVQGHPFNNPKYRGAQILLAGPNYGCGSSREHAPQALYRYGIRAVIAPSFAEIFAGNCASLGLIAARVAPEAMEELLSFVEGSPEEELHIDLSSKLLSYGPKSTAIEMPEGRRRSFLDGTWDAMAVLMQNEEGIEGVRKSLDYLFPTSR